MFKRLVAGCFLLTYLISASGCSPIMAARQPPYRDLGIIQKSVEREKVIAEFGNPTYTEKTPDGGRYDIYTFKQGYGKGNKAFRIMFHIAADVFTLFLWEIIGTPAEMIADGKDVKFKAVYDVNDKLISYEDFNSAKIPQPK